METRTPVKIDMGMFDAIAAICVLDWMYPKRRRRKKRRYYGKNNNTLWS